MSDIIRFNPHQRFLGKTPADKRAELRSIVSSSLVDDAIMHAFAQMSATNSSRDELNGALKFIAIFQNFSEPMPQNQPLPEKGLKSPSLS